MYNPPSFAEQRPGVMLDFIDAHPLGALVTASADGLFATHVPFVLDRAAGPHGTLRAHVARANPHSARAPLTAEAHRREAATAAWGRACRVAKSR